MYVLNVAIAGFGGVGRAVAHLLLSRRERYLRLYGTENSPRGGLRLFIRPCRCAGLEPERLDELEPGLSGPDFVIGSGATVLIEGGPSDYRPAALVLPISAALWPRASMRLSSRRARSSTAAMNCAPSPRARGAMCGFEGGAAAAALPTIDLVEHSLLGCTVLQVEGILNATTNYLLDAMTGRGIDFEEALREAQAGGFAEADPRNDTEAGIRRRNC